jgi:hypothetical protein
MSLIAGRPSRTALRAARLILTGTRERCPRLPRLLARGGGEPARVGA